MRAIFVLILTIILAACASVPPPPPPPVVTSLPPVVETVAVTDALALGLAAPLDGWVVAREVPGFLLAEFVHHIEHELADRGQVRSRDEMEDVARKRLESNEVIIYNPVSRAWIAIDFSPLHVGEKPPDRQMLYNSARYAAESLAGEEGVTDVVSRVSAVGVAGADHAFRLDADFRSHGAPRRFAGVIGFSDSDWFYVYYTDPLASKGDYPLIDTLLDNLTILPRGRE